MDEVVGPNNFCGKDKAGTIFMNINFAFNFSINEDACYIAYFYFSRMCHDNKKEYFYFSLSNTVFNSLHISNLNTEAN